ncbi:MAG: hypothetical protein B7Y89_17700 [Novosphingobium sp. 32-60-15]|uniref:transposase n=1 Tax=Novosphingobium sp. 32-60-15 TaxID=1970410 RepID=UPI000BCCD46A|nr:transposase [Novosphingobium sp. 32-60-15]OYX59774.1 MAG: hypothetical protein B7Y89_17700 [Novosphingobium sp. 32-60-15]
MTEIRTTIAGSDIAVHVDRTASLGWRFWTLGGFPADPIEPRAYGVSRCLPLDRSFRLFCTHHLFPSASQDGVESFAQEIIEHHSRQPRLL